MRRLIIIVTLLFLLTACQGTQQVELTGKEGLTLEFGDNLPPKDVFEGTIVPFQINIENEGTFDIANDAKAELSLAYDHFYLTVENADRFPRGIEELYGRDIRKSRGDSQYVQGALRIKSVLGQRENPSTAAVKGDR